MIINLIIPTYNSRDTLERTLGSIVAQTNNKRIIVSVIDDSSTENIDDIIDKFNSLITINCTHLSGIYQKNLGKPGLVRQYGIDHTNADYIMFLDSDDVLAPNAAEVLNRAVRQEQYEYINSAFYREYDGKYELIRPNQITWLHGNIYSRKFLDKWGIRFDDRLNEDGSFNLKCFWLSDKKGVIEQPMAYWLENKKSLTRGNNNFMIDIAEDYVATYSDAFKFIVEKKPELLGNKKFVADCASKLGQFFEFIDAQVYYKGESTERMGKEIENYVQFLKDNELLDNKFLNQANFNFNKFDVFPCAVRQNNILDYFDFFGIDYSDWQKKNLEGKM